MESLFHLTVFTPQSLFHEGEASSLVAPGESGYLGILAHHAPLMTTLRPGKIVVKDATGQQTIFQSQGNGLLEVLRNKVILMVDEVRAFNERKREDIPVE